LDVHISWLRDALEIDPRNPRFLKTVRGVGYRLDV
jgi:DNA-binding response OmpR family regulator